MKKCLIACFIAFMAAGSAFGQLFINEIDYDQPSTDHDEFVELAGPAGAYSNVVLELVNGNDGAVYNTFAVGNITLTDAGNGYGFLKVDTPAIQNGSPDGVQLKVNGSIVDAVCYEGPLNDTNGNPMEYADENIVMPPYESDDGMSLSRLGLKGAPWSIVATTPGTINTGQVLDANANYAPTAFAGADKTAGPGDLVTLDGSASSDPENRALTYLWKLESGSGITLSSTSEAIVTFTVPDITENTTWTFSLTVTDDADQSDTDTVLVAAYLSSQVTMAEARALPIGAFVEVQGVVNSINYSSSGTEYTFQDETGGLDLYFTGAILDFAVGDELQVKGLTEDYNGKLEVVPASESDIVKIQSGVTLTAQVITVGELAGNGENYESELIQILGVTNTGTGDSWPASGSNANINISDNGTDVAVLRIDKETDVDGSEEPKWPADVTGVVTEYSGVYQILPRSLSDISGDMNAPTFGTPVLTANGSTFLTGNTQIIVSVDITPAEGQSIGTVSVAYGSSGVFPSTAPMAQYSGSTYMGAIPARDENSELEVKIVADGYESSVTSFVVSATSLTPISEIHAHIDSLNGLVTTIQGVVTMGVNLLQTGVSKGYIQDESGRGLNFFDGVVLEDLARGAEVKMAGIVELYGGSTVEIRDFSYELISTGNPLPAAVSVTPDQANSSDWEGTLIEVEGEVTDIWTNTTNTLTKYTVTDPNNSSSSTAVVNWHTTGLDLSSILLNSHNRFKGVGSAYNGEFQMLIAYREDLKLLTSIDGNPMEVREFRLHPAYPNPFNPSTRLSVDLPESADLTVRIYDISGRKVADLSRSAVPAGSSLIEWNGAKQASGVYFVRVRAGQYSAVQKIMLIK